MKSTFRRIPGFVGIAFAGVLSGAAAHAQSAFTEIGYGSSNASLGPGNLRDAGGMPYALYVFEGEAGRRVSATIAAQTFSPAIALYRVSDGSTLATAHGKSSATASAVLQDDGLYILSVTSVDQTYRYVGTRDERRKFEMIGKAFPLTVRFAPGTVTVGFPGHVSEAREYKLVERNLYQRSSGGELSYIRVLDSSTLESFTRVGGRTVAFPTYKLDTGRYSIRLTSEDAKSAGMSAATGVARIYALQNGDQTIAVQTLSFFSSAALNDARRMGYRPDTVLVHHSFARNQVLADNPDGVYFEEKGGRGHLFNRNKTRVATNGFPGAKSRYALVRVNSRWESGRKNGAGIHLYYPNDAGSLYVYLAGNSYTAQTYNGKWTVQVRSTKHSAIRPDADNVLELLTIDGKFRLYINGVFAHEFVLSSASEPSFHYFANAGAVHSFDDYVAIGLRRQ